MKQELRRGTEEDRKRLRVPPKYTNLMVSADPTAKVQGLARTPKGKTAYFYHPEFVAKKQLEKWRRVRLLVKKIDLVVKKVEEDVAAGVPEALTVRLILQTGMRNGNPGQGEKESFGASSLRFKHVRVEGSKIIFDFPGKKGVLQHFEIEDEILLARILKARRVIPFDLADAGIFSHSASATLTYLKGLDSRLKVHDLRTWFATMLATAFVEAFRAEGVPEKKLELLVCKAVAEKLGNTPAVVRKSYMDPLLFAKEKA